jgi:hypothetical protein
LPERHRERGEAIQGVREGLDSMRVRVAVSTGRDVDGSGGELRAAPAPAATSVLAPQNKSARRSSGQIEIELPDGSRIRVGVSVSLASLHPAARSRRADLASATVLESNRVWRRPLAH